MKRLFLFHILLLTGCGSLTELTSVTSKFRIRIYGSSTAATGADGTEAPDSMTVTVQSITMHEVSAAANTDLLKNGTTEYKILSRPQAIYINDDTTDYEAKQFDNVTITLAAAAKVVDKTSTSYNLTLTTTALASTETFTVEKHENRQLTIKAAWGKTIKTDATTGAISALQPTFTLSFTE